jgi:hydroxyacylglutathione hydrolase
VGRPDLAAKSKLSAKELAGMLFDSLQKIKTLDDSLRILPGHGSGSGCGRSIGKGDSSTLGEQRESNYGLIIGDKPEFINALLA